MARCWCLRQRDRLRPQHKTQTLRSLGAEGSPHESAVQGERAEADSHRRRRQYWLKMCTRCMRTQLKSAVSL